MKKYTLPELGNLMGQVGVLQSRVAEADSQIGHKEHTLDEIEKEYNRAVSKRDGNKSISMEIDTLKRRRGEDELQLKELFKILKENGVSVSESLQHTVVSI